MAEQGPKVKGCGKHVDQEVDVESRIIRASPGSSAMSATSPGSAFPMVPLKAVSRVAPLPLSLCAGSPYRARAEPRARQRPHRRPSGACLANGDISSYGHASPDARSPSIVTPR